MTVNFFFLHSEWQSLVFKSWICISDDTSCGVLLGCAWRPSLCQGGSTGAPVRTHATLFCSIYGLLQLHLGVRCDLPSDVARIQAFSCFYYKTLFKLTVVTEEVNIDGFVKKQIHLNNASSGLSSVLKCGLLSL